MFKEYFLILVLGHILGDFYFQTQNMAEKKEKRFGWVAIHGLCYFIIQLALSVFLWSYEIAVAITIASCAHFVIDAVKYRWIKSLVATERNLFFIDQGIHLLCIVGIAYGMAFYQVELRELMICRTFFDVTGLSERAVLSWGLALLLIHKPANITIQKILSAYKPTDEADKQSADIKAGRFIGTLERVIMLFFMGINQYSAIGLVLTAKSIARYEKITKEKDFAEYYLLGTLLSTMVVIICAGII